MSRVFIDTSFIGIPPEDLPSLLSTTFNDLEDDLNAGADLVTITDAAQILPEGIRRGDVVLRLVRDELSIGIYNGIEVIYTSMGTISGAITDAQHGQRGGGDLHTLATNALAGFLSPANLARILAALQNTGDNLLGPLYLYSGTQQGAIFAQAGLVALAFGQGLIYDPANGGLALRAGLSTLAGSVTSVDSLKGTGLRDVQCDAAGNLVPADLPAPMWTLTDTDTGIYNSGTGGPPLPWVRLTGLEVTITATEVEAVAVRVEFNTRLFMVNVTSNRTGVVEIGVGLNGVQPVGAGVSFTIASGFAGYVSGSGIKVQTTSLGQLYSVWIRVTSSNNNAFGVTVNGSGGNLSEFTMRRPSTILLNQLPSLMNNTQLPTFTFATLPTLVWPGRRASITDASPPYTFRQAASGGGAQVMPVFYDGAIWCNG